MDEIKIDIIRGRIYNANEKITYWRLIRGILWIVLDDLELPLWNVKYFTQRSAWNFDIQINFSKCCMKSDIEHKDVSTEIKEYWKSIL